MPRFRIRLMTEDGQVIHTELTADSPAIAIETCRQSGHYVLRCRPHGWPSRLLASRAHPPAAPPGQATLLRELACLLRDGAEVSQALEILIPLEPSRSLRDALTAGRARVRAGDCLSGAFEAVGPRLPRLAIGMMQAGEASGALADMLGQCADYLDRSEALRQRLRTALLYPTIVLITGAASVAFVLIDVLPAFAPIFTQAGVPMPTATHVLVSIGTALSEWGWALPPVGLTVVLLLRRARHDPTARRRMDAALLRLPLLGSTAQLAEAARFCRALGSITRAGTDLPSGLTLATATIGNAAIASALNEAAPLLREGQKLSRILARHQGFPPVAIQFVRLGEENGRLEQMLLRAADLLEGRLLHRLARLQTALLPILTILLGGMVGMIVAAVMQALIRLNDLAI